MNKKRSKQLKKLIFVSTLSAIVLTVSTYAWFIGMKTVNVSSFDVEVAASKSLFLSLDGEKWANTVNISKETLDDVSYSGHTNSWGGRGLMPMSSVGEMDSTASRMMLYEKASLTTTTGGYRLLASRVDNHSTGKKEQDGYVAFDLFVHNFSGTQYIPALNTKDEEAIYLTTDSSVTVASTGVEATGIENSVRVAFAQIGRVAGTTTDASKITGITCTSTGTTEADVTGICRTAQIWEPNDKRHVDSAISWYTTSCQKRLNGEIEESSYTTAGGAVCGTVADGTSNDTYAIRRAITNLDKVDVYDGIQYNLWNGHTYDPTNADTASYPLYNYDYFTDTEKIKTGTTRPTFMTLAPNSITKIRVYIYIEGQDIDNYDFAQIGKKIAVKFGLTKERFTQEDIGYNGPEIVTPTE